MDTIIYLIPLFFITALIYSSVGFGGGSTYLALLFLSGFSYVVIPKIALICNLVVVSQGLFIFLRSKNLNLKQALPFVICSSPFAYLGGSFLISRDLFLILLGLSLMAAGLRLLYQDKSPSYYDSSSRLTLGIGLISGAVLGFFSGLVGIGGGIFLAPILYFLRWQKPKQIAATSSLFIFVNSLAGLMGQSTKEDWQQMPVETLGLVFAVLLGGLIGGHLCVDKWSPLKLQRITAGLILFVSSRIFWEVIG